jgi:ascorbate PTS system EIIA or EIIAB component
MLKTLVENKHTVFHESFDSWEEAIQAGCEPLLQDQTITQEYVNLVIQCVKDFGPYIVIAPMIAMPHSTQGAAGVNATKISFMKVEQPVHFKEDKDPEYDAKLFFTLASLDGDQHMQNIMQLSEMLMNQDVVDALLEAKSNDDLLAIHDKYLKG